MGEEIQMMEERDVWDLVDKPKDSKCLGCRWVFNIKRDESGKIARLKARLVAQGYRQVKGESYDETYSPVVNFSVIRFFFSLLVCNLGWTHKQFDVKCAYLYAPLNEEIYMSQPPGFFVGKNKNAVCRLKKAIYGLHQSGRMWFYEMEGVLLKIGFDRFDHCNCVYSYQGDVILMLYVDDFVVFGKDEFKINNIVKRLEKHFDLKALGKTKRLLGVEFEQEGDSLLMHQNSYIDQVYERFYIYSVPIRTLPISKGHIYSKSQSPQSKEENQDAYPYRNLLGCLSFLAGRTRPDISYAVNIFSQFQNAPGLTHWSGLLSLLGYVYSTKSLKLKFKCDNPQIIVYSDADFAANRDDRISMGGQFLFLGNSPVIWRSFKEKCVSLSTMEAELVAMTEATKELIWFDNILKECSFKGLLPPLEQKSILYVDNQSTINFVKSPVENSRTKHIDVKLFFVRELICKELFEIMYVKSKNNMADVFTKPLTKFNLDLFKRKVFVNVDK